MATFDGSNSTEQTTEVYVKKILAGNIGEVRRQLVAAVEAMGYDIIEEDPHIIGRRSAKGWGVWMSSADVLDYPMTLTVRLKSVGQNSTRATFDYLIKHPFLTKGEKAVIAQEAVTIASISKKQAIERLCAACETESTGDSKFCRGCGAPLTSEHAETEILRMMAEVCAGKTSVVSSSVLMIASVVILAVFFILNLLGKIENPKAVFIFLLLSGATALTAILCSFFGWNRINRALSKPAEQKISIPQNTPESLETGEFAALPPHRSTPASVTEGTTNLLDEEWITKKRKKEKVPAANRRETNDLN